MQVTVKYETKKNLQPRAKWKAWWQDIYHIQQCQEKGRALPFPEDKIDYFAKLPFMEE